MITNDISRTLVGEIFLPTSIPAISMISHEISWRYFSSTSDTSDTCDTSDTSNTTNSSDASKASASVIRLSSYLQCIFSSNVFLRD